MIPINSTELASALAGLLGEPVHGLRRLTAGASRETWKLTAGGRQLVLRRDPPGAARATSMAREAECLRAAALAGVPVPELIAAGNGEDQVGTPYLLMKWMDGETLPQRLLRGDRWAAVRPRLAHELGGVLARIHAIDVADVGSLEHVDDRLAALRTQHEGFGGSHPALEVAFRWLAANRPEPVAPGLVHGDFRNGNFMIAEAGVAAVLDWELAHIGDPREDLGWLCTRAWRFGHAAPVGGFGSREEMLDGYFAVSGRRPDPAAVHWWEVFGCVHWAVICRMQASRHLDGGEPSVELAVLGRRAAEAEYDALLALGLLGDEVPPDPLAAGTDLPTSANERPSADELLAAVSDFLTTELQTDDPRSGYLAKVAATALAVVRRELRVSSGDGWSAGEDAALAAGVRSGALDPDADEVRSAVVASALARLAVANPRYAAVRPDP